MIHLRAPLAIAAFTAIRGESAGGNPSKAEPLLPALVVRAALEAVDQRHNPM